MNKKSLLLIILFLLLVTGCSTNKEAELNRKYNTKNLDYITCTRNTETTDNSSVDINIDVYYNSDNYIEILKSKEIVTSNDSNVLKQYKEAYENVYSVYSDLEYYDNKVTLKNNTVTSTTYINYGKIDMDKLMKIEGSEDNVKVTVGKIKLNDWKSFAKKYGTECQNGNA